MSGTTEMINVNIEEFIKPVVGKMAWQLMQGYGSFITMEFGLPHLDVSEPVIFNRSEAPPSVKKNDKATSLFNRRRVFIRGEWHLWIQYCTWSAESHQGKIANSNMDLEKNRPILDEIDGQYVNAIHWDLKKMIIEIVFDLGAKISIGIEPHTTEGPIMALYGPENEYLELRNDKVEDLVAYSGSPDEHF